MPILETTVDPAVAPPPDPDAEPEGFVVDADTGDRLHFLDWGGPSNGGGPAAGRADPRVLLVHGLAQTAWVWAPVARRLRAATHVVAMDLRGHGLSDSPTEGYEPDDLAADAIAVAEGSGLLDRSRDDRIVLAGHGFGGAVAAWAAAALGPRCAGLVLVDGGWDDLPQITGMEPDEFLRGLDEPPEVLRSMGAYLADRKAFDPRTWDRDQDRAARAAVVETHAGRLVPVTRPHALARTVEALFAYRPDAVLPAVEAPILALVAADDESGHASTSLAAAGDALERAGRPPLRVVRFAGDGHNLPRYRPAQVTAAILSEVLMVSGTLP